MPNCNFEGKKYPDAGIIFNYVIDNFLEAYWESVCGFRYIAKENILQGYLTQIVIKTSKNYPGGNPGYNLHGFDIRHHQDFVTAQPNKVWFDFSRAVPAATSLIRYALLLTNKLVSVSGDGQTHFDLVRVTMFNFFIGWWAIQSASRLS